MSAATIALFAPILLAKLFLLLLVLADRWARSRKVAPE